MFGRGNGRSTRRPVTVAAVLLISLTAAACTASGDTASPGASAVPGATATPAASATPTPVATPTATAPESAAPSIGPLIDGQWTGLRWVSDGKPAPADQPADASPSGPEVDSQFALFGWSKGYVGFEESTTWPADSSGTPTTAITSATSADGLHWTAGKAIQLPADVASIGRVVEGPGGLLAVGYPMAATCGGPAIVRGLWRSQDGVEWTAVPLPFGTSSVFRIDGGGAGYIAFGVKKDGTSPAVWTSTDGTHWTAQTPPVSAKTGAITDATAFAGGFVIVGASLDGEGCGGPGSKSPAVWYSAAGSSWIREALPGAASASDVWMSVSRVSDTTLWALVQSTDATTQATTTATWISRDGRTWTAFEPPVAVNSFVSNGSRGVAIVNGDKGETHFWAFEPDGTMRELQQTGATLPSSEDQQGGWQEALGPAGIVVTDGLGSRFFVGVPTAD